MYSTHPDEFLSLLNTDSGSKKIAEKVLNFERITEKEALHLYKKTETGILACLADFIRHQKNSNKVFYINNVHLEPTNVCICNCRFCSYKKNKGERDAWQLNLHDIETRTRNMDISVKEIHITGGTHPEATVESYIQILEVVRKARPDVHIKAFSAAELHYIFNKEKVSPVEGINILKKYGLNSIPGGGAEIFNEEIRMQICPEKATSDQWLAIHEAAHSLSLFSNATMLYGHIEKYEHRIDHMTRLRTLQDKTCGFLAFIPLKYKNKNNKLSYVKETTLIEDMRNYAVSRIFLDNFSHIKAYWPMLGKEYSQLSLSFGVDDIDGTINNSTKIYSTAGSEIQEPQMSVKELQDMILQAGFIPVERNSDYTTA